MPKMTVPLRTDELGAIRIDRTRVQFEMLPICNHSRHHGALVTSVAGLVNGLPRFYSD